MAQGHPIEDPPGLAQLILVSRALSGAGVVHGLGGTGLLFALGFNVRPRDWDILTDAPLEHIKLALASHPITQVEQSATFPSDYLVEIPADGSGVEIIGGFTIATPARVLRIPTRVTGRFRGVPLSHPADWILAYRAMELLHGANDRDDRDKIRMLEKALKMKKRSEKPLAAISGRHVVSD
ncbi:MAG: hypothetical protein V2J20_08945 [Wenzhouxiangella sp.]|nr:hypothetical protein [Wenzhouxiangella sp.]